MQLNQKQVTNWHRSTVLLFMFMGWAWAAMLTRMPLIKADLRVTSAQLGLLLIAGGIGALVGLNLIGRLVAKRGTKFWIRLLYPSAAILILIGAVVVELHLPIGYAIVGFFLGMNFSMVDVPVNVDGTQLEKETGRTLMPRLHAGYSLGTLLGSGWGSACAALNLGIFETIVIPAIVQGLIPFLLLKHLPADTGIERVREAHEPKPSHWFQPVLILFGLGILGITLAEGGAGDWMTLGFKEGYGSTEAQAGIGFSIFFIGMVIVRYFGGNIADKIGKGRALQLLAGIGVLGILLVIFSSPTLPLGWLGAGLWGVGVALGFPLFLSAAGQGENSARRVSFVATWGYGAFLAGPPILGLLADHVGMLNMFFVMAGFMIMALLASSAVKNK